MSESSADLTPTLMQVNPAQKRISALFDINRYEQAEQLIREQLAQDPEDSYWLFNLARALLGQDKEEAAEEALLRGLSCDPDHDWSYYLLSLVSHRLKHFSNELEYAQKAASLDPQEPVFLQRLAEAHLQNGEVNAAHQALQQMIELDPDSLEAFQLLGEIELQLNNYPEAEAAFRQALTFDPEDVALLNDLARSLMGQKAKLREAIDLWYNIVQLDPANEIFTENLLYAIRHWIDKNSYKGQAKKALAELPEPLQYFYHDHQERSSIFEAWGRLKWILVWIGVFVGLMVFFSLVGK